MRVQKALGEDEIKFKKKPFMTVSGEALKSELEREYQEKITISDVEERIQRNNPELYSKIMEAKSSYEEFRNSVSNENSKSSQGEVASSGPMVALKDEKNVRTGLYRILELTICILFIAHSLTQPP